MCFKKKIIFLKIFFFIKKNTMSEVIKAGLSLEYGEGMTYNLIKIFFPFFTGLLILNTLIAFMNPKLKDYTQGNISSWQSNLYTYTNAISTILYFLAGFFIYTIPLFKVGVSIGRGEMGGIYSHLVPVVVLNVLLYLLHWFFSSFTKWDYNSAAVGNSGAEFHYCKIDEASEHNLTQNAGTCKWTKWQAIRDTVCFSFSFFFDKLGFYNNPFLYSTSTQFYNLWFWIVLAGLLKTIL